MLWHGSRPHGREGSAFPQIRRERKATHLFERAPQAVDARPLIRITDPIPFQTKCDKFGIVARFDC